MSYIRIDQDPESAVAQLTDSHRALAQRDPERWALMQVSNMYHDQRRPDIPKEGTRNVAVAVNAVMRENEERISTGTRSQLENAIKGILG